MTIDTVGIQAVVDEFIAAWNRGDSATLASLFAPDADFINVLGRHERGREAIAAGHREIFDTVYRDSRNRYTVRAVRPLTDDLVVVFADALLEFATDGIERELPARPTLVMKRNNERWCIVVFQNTLLAAPGSRSGADLPVARTQAAGAGLELNVN
jgi:uncharacterized protein (TIGR02246 family)